MADKIYVGDIGTKFIIATGVDLTEANSLAVKVKKPNNDIVTWSCEKEEPPTDGKMFYTTKAGDISCSGIYRGNAKVSFSSGESLTGETFDFAVYDDFDELSL